MSTEQPAQLNATEIVADMAKDPSLDFYFTTHPDQITDEQFRNLIRRQRITRETDVKK